MNLIRLNEALNDAFKSIRVAQNALNEVLGAVGETSTAMPKRGQFRHYRKRYGYMGGGRLEKDESLVVREELLKLKERVGVTALSRRLKSSNSTIYGVLKGKNSRVSASFGRAVLELSKESALAVRV